MMQVAIARPSVFASHGDRFAQIAEALADAHGFPPGAGLLPQALVAPDPTAADLGMDRRTLRTTDKQARLLLAAAIRSLAPFEDAKGDECGLFLGLPTVDEALPGPQALADWIEEGRRTPLPEHMKRHTAPLGWLGMLNSSAAAHVSTRLGLAGPTAVYSPFADAGLDALIDAAIAVHEGECREALVGGVAPKHDPILPLQYTHWAGAAHALPGGEAAACAVVQAPERPGACLRLSGYARGFEPVPWAESDVMERVVDRAREMAGIERADIGWLLSLAPWDAAQERSLDRMHRAHAGARVLELERTLGRLGPAGPFVALGLIAHAFEHGHAWATDANTVRRVSWEGSHALVTAVAPGGQCAAVVLGGIR